MSLNAVWGQLIDDFEKSSDHIAEFIRSHSSLASSTAFTYRDECELEGILSRLWQSWGKFCRDTVIESCLGSINGSGVAIAPHPDALSWQHVSGAAIRAKSSVHPPTWGTANGILRNEPTWGDTDVLATILPRLGPSNISELQLGFSAGHSAAKTIQTIRNGTAHLNVQTLKSILDIQSAYIAFPITHPTHALFWLDPISRQFLVMQAIEDLTSGATAAIF